MAKAELSEPLFVWCSVFSTKAHTIDHFEDPLVDAKRVEWFTDRRHAHVVYGLLLRFAPEGDSTTNPAAPTPDFKHGVPAATSASASAAASAASASAAPFGDLDGMDEPCPVLESDLLPAFPASISTPNPPASKSSGSCSVM
jgi:hypothetical protein